MARAKLDEDAPRLGRHGAGVAEVTEDKDSAMSLRDLPHSPHQAPRDLWLDCPERAYEQGIPLDA